MHSSLNLSQQTVAIIGGGPAGLMAAEVLSRAGAKVHVFDSMPSVGRKFLMAGKGGMNITHSEPFETFLSRFGARKKAFEPLLKQFGPTQLRTWLRDLGIETFVGSSGRVFPIDLKAAPLLRLWLHRLRQQGVEFHMRHQWLNWNANNSLECQFMHSGKPITFKADAIVLALGGASWPKLGSTGTWVDILKARAITIEPLKPANCGFETRWSAIFSERFAGQPLKSVKVTFRDTQTNPIELHGEFVITKTGIEGSAIYALSAPIREQLIHETTAILYVDLAPERSLDWLTQQLSKPRGKMSLSNFLRKHVHLEGVKAGLLRELARPDAFNVASELAACIKYLPIPLHTTRPLEEAISTAGGVAFEELDAQLMLTQCPGVFCAGEMLDWEAPTGGYLLTASFATGYCAGLGVLSWLQQRGLQSDQ